jgi:hypothetical protein
VIARRRRLQKTSADNIGTKVRDAMTLGETVVAWDVVYMRHSCDIVAT